MLSPSIARISIIKAINRQTRIKIENQLKNLNLKKTKAIFVDIISGSGSLNQSIEIAEVFKYFRKEQPKIPILTFAEDQVLGPGVAILSVGDKVYSDNNSFFGCYDFIKRGNDYKEYLKQKEFNLKFHTAGEHKFRLNPFDELKEKDVEWINNLLRGMKSVLVEYVYETRKNSIRNPNAFRRFFDSSIHNTSEAINIGLIDQVGLIDTVAMELFPGLQMKKAKTKTSLKDLINHYKNQSTGS